MKAAEPLTLSNKEEIKEQGYGITGFIGGQRKQRYWTPDGREILVQQDMHEYARKENGKVIGTGIRDANLDKGWLLSPPVAKKVYCPHCDRWHDDNAGIAKCKKKKQLLIRKYSKEVKEETEKGRLDKLESDMTDIKGMLKQLLEVRSGKVLQPESNAAQKAQGHEGNGGNEERVQL